MKNVLLFVVFAILFLACKNEGEISLHFLDEYVLKDSIRINKQLVGGLSGVDYSNNQLFFPVDDFDAPRIFVADVEIQQDKITHVHFNKVIELKDSIIPFYKNNVFDLESIFVDENTNEIHLVSEGAINRSKKPSVFKIDKNGKFVENFELPNSLSNITNIKHNSAFEASTISSSKNGFWVAMEAPLKVDGVQPTFSKTKSPVRITYFDFESKKAVRQYAYELDHIQKKSNGDINLNGVTAILEYQNNHFLILERTYQNEFGIYGNSVKIFEAFVDENATDILNMDSLKKRKYIPLKKSLLLNFEDIKSQLTDKIVDNIEGITFGPQLSNGNRSLILVSDDNFQLYGKQLNQFILLEIKTNK